MYPIFSAFSLCCSHVNSCFYLHHDFEFKNLTSLGANLSRTHGSILVFFFLRKQRILTVKYELPTQVDISIQYAKSSIKFMIAGTLPLIVVSFSNLAQLICQHITNV